ncbi:maleate cis-trans isomerase family protein [Roseobacter sp. A03A-229]
MTQAPYPYGEAPAPPHQLGLIVLQADLTIEDEFRRMVPADVRLLVSRVPSGVTVTPDTLAEMEQHLTQAASLFPQGCTFGAVGYGCTSGTAQIGAQAVAEAIRRGTDAATVTDPLTALIAACDAFRFTRLALLSPYIETVSARLRDRLRAAGIETPVFGSFGEAEEAKVARIDGPSIVDAATDLAAGAEVDALFLSCTNLRTLDVIHQIEQATGLPVLSSNLVLAWHLLMSTGRIARDDPPGGLVPDLFQPEGRAS